MKFLLISLLLLSSCFWDSQSDESKGRHQVERKPGLFLFENKKIKEGVVAQIGDLLIKEEVFSEDKALKPLKEEYNEVLFSQFYLQFVTYNEEDIQSVTYLGPKVLRPVKEILNQYGVKERQGIKVDFKTSPEKVYLANVGNKKIKYEALDKSNYLMGVVATKIFNQKKSFILRRVKNYFLKKESEKLGISISEYLERYVFSQISKDFGKGELEKYLRNQEKELKLKNIEMAMQSLIAKREFKALDYVMEKHVLDLPIYINIEVPKFYVDSELKWTFHTPGKNKLRVTLFSDTEGSMSEALIRSIPNLIEKYGAEAQFLFRPVFSQDSRAQRTVVQSLFCFNDQNSQNLWNYMAAVSGRYGDDTENIIKKNAKTYLETLDSFNNCLYKQQKQELVKYHQDYGKYLGIHAGPVVYIGGEVYHGSLTPELFEKILRDHLGYPDAGVW